MANPIVNVSVSQTSAPAPSRLQQTGAIISQGGTTLSSNTLSLLTQQASLASILASSLAVTSQAWSTGVVTTTTTAPHGITTSDTFLTTISGNTSVGYNGAFLATATGASTFTYSVAVNPGSSGGTITYTPRNVAELVRNNNTYWAQGSNQSVYVLELGAGEPATGIASLSTYITSNQYTIYAFLIPDSWDAAATFLTLATAQNGTTARVYFFVNTTTGTYTSYTSTMKSVLSVVPASGTTVTQSAAAAVFWDVISTAPSATNKVAPFEYRIEFGITPWQFPGNLTTLTNITNANSNYIGSGSQAGLSSAILYGGKFSDGNPINYWYAADYAQIQGNLAVANAVANGSNNPINPLYFNQPGINALQSVLAGVMTSMATFGMSLYPVVQTELDGGPLSAAISAGTYAQNTIVNAIPFSNYVVENPSDYSIGQYSGLSVQFVPLRGFDKINFNIVVSTFAG